MDARNEGLRCGQSLPVSGRQINNQAHHSLSDEAAAANAEPTDFDQAGELPRRPHDEAARACFQMDAIVAHQHCRGYLS